MQMQKRKWKLQGYLMTSCSTINQELKWPWICGHYHDQQHNYTYTILFGPASPHLLTQAGNWLSWASYYDLEGMEGQQKWHLLCNNWRLLNYVYILASSDLSWKIMTNMNFWLPLKHINTKHWLVLSKIPYYIDYHSPETSKARNSETIDRRAKRGSIWTPGA